VPGEAPLTRDQVATAIRRLAASQVEDIERAVKDGHKTIALNELADLNRQLKAFAAALKKAPVRA
jgi:3-deoxy-D-manno-octulosonic acid (KDO) 8-phosphate synthase